jgi:hypothetical protein
MLCQLVDAGLVHTQQAQTFLKLLLALVYDWPAAEYDHELTRTPEIWCLLRQVQASIRQVYTTQAAAGSSSSSSSTSERIPAQAASLLVQLQSAFVSLAQCRFDDLQAARRGASAVAVAALLPILGDRDLQEACLQLLAGACCCWHQQHTRWQQQQQRQSQASHHHQQQQQQQLPPLQRTWLQRRVLQLRVSDTAAPKVPYWAPGIAEPQHFPTEGCAAYSEALSVWLQKLHSPARGCAADANAKNAEDSSALLSDCIKRSPFDVCTSSAVWALTLHQGVLAEAAAARIVPAAVQLTADAVLLLNWRLQEIERQQQQEQSGQQLQQQNLHASPARAEIRLPAEINQLQKLLDLQLAAAARSIAAGVAQQSPPWAGKAVLLASVIEAQRTVAAAATGAGQSGSSAQAVDEEAPEKPSACAQRLLQRLSKALSSEGELQAAVQKGVMEALANAVRVRARMCVCMSELSVTAGNCWCSKPSQSSSLQDQMRTVSIIVASIVRRLLLLLCCD